MDDSEVTVAQTTSHKAAQYKRVDSHYALISLDDAGNLHLEASPSISNCREKILSPKVTKEFLQAVAQSQSSQGAMWYAQTSEGELVEQSSPSLLDEDKFPQCTGFKRAQQPWEHTFPPSPITPLSWSANPFHQSDSTMEALQHNFRAWGGEVDHNSRIATVPLGNSALLRQYYAKVFQNLQQTNCRVISKVYVRLIEPRKQVNYPYNGRKTVAGVTRQLDPDDTKPPWWPEGVSHREPDHLPKAERIQLLVHMLCDLRTSHGVTAQRLKAADQSIRRQILPATRLELLDEMYNIREKEEKLLDGEIDMNAQVVISRINLPDGMDPATITAQQLNTSDSSYGHNPKVQFKLRKPPPYRNHAQDFVQSVPSNSYTAVNIPNHIPKDVMHAAQAVNAQSASLLTPDLSENFHGTEKSLLSAGRIVPIDHYVPIGANSQSTIPIPRPQTSYFPLQGGNGPPVTQYATQTLGAPMVFYEDSELYSGVAGYY